MVGCRYDLVNVSAPSHEVPSGGALRPKGLRHFLDDHGHAEDEVLYRDSRGDLHLLMHGFYDKFPGGHGWTTDKTGRTGWEFSETAAYTFAAFLDGKLTTLGQRERPQVVIQNGSITHLFNGARGPKGKEFNGGNTFNMVTEICQHGPAVAGVCPARAEDK